MSFKRPHPPIPPVYLPKWSEPVLQEGFVPFPKTMLRCLNELLSGTADDVLMQLRVILTIADAKRVSPYRPPTLAYLAYNAGLTESQFIETVYALVAYKRVVLVDANDKNFDVSLAPLLESIETMISQRP